MTITLTSEESQDYLEYFNAITKAKEDSLGLVVTSDDFNSYITTSKSIVADLNAVIDTRDAYIKSLRLQIGPSSPTLDHHSKLAIDTSKPEAPITNDATVTFTKPTSRWSKSDIGIIRWRIDPKSTAATSERTLKNLMSKFPSRSEQSIRSKVHTLGGRIVKGQILPKKK